MASESNFWSNLLQKVLKIIFKSALGGEASSHHQHVVPHEEGWAVRGEGNERVTAIYDRQSQAIDRAREIATNYKADVIIHGEDGRIRDRMSYK